MIHRLLAFLDLLNAIKVVVLHPSHQRIRVDNSWAQILLRLIQDRNSSKLRLGILIGVRNTVLLFNCYKGTMGHLVLCVPLVDHSSEVVLLSSGLAILCL